jgi:hypothetical protein
MALFKPYKIKNSELEKLTKKEGQIIFLTDTKEIYIDMDNNSRIKINFNNTDKDLDSLDLSKIYYILGLDRDTFCKYSYYNIGDFIIYNHTPYECIKAVTTVGD